MVKCAPQLRITHIGFTAVLGTSTKGSFDLMNRDTCVCWFTARSTAKFPCWGRVGRMFFFALSVGISQRHRWRSVAHRWPEPRTLAMQVLSNPYENPAQSCTPLDVHT